MTDLPSIHSDEAAASCNYAMTNEHGEFFYPDNEEDAQHFAEFHGAWFINDEFTWD